MNERNASRARLSLALLVLSGCMSSDEHVAEADAEVYDILDRAAEHVTGTRKNFPVDRPVDTLRARLIESPVPVRLDLMEALDVAAENSREFQTQRETLYRTGLSLTQAQFDFAVRYGNVSDATVSGENEDPSSISFTNDLSASVNTFSGGRLVAGFATTFLESLINGNSLLTGPQNVLSLTFTQPLLRGFGSRVVREPLTQAERNVVYAMRDFERFRSGFTLRIVQDYYRVLRLMADLENTRINLEGLKTDLRKTEATVKAGRTRAEDLDQTRQSTLAARNSVITTEANLGATLDEFKLTLGLPMESKLALDPSEFDKLAQVDVADLLPSDAKLDGANPLDEDRLVEFAKAHRYDYRNTLDRVADAGRKILVAENALGSFLDFSSAINIPNTAANKPFDIDWDKIDWSAGFRLDLALQRLTERNAYRRALISFQVAIRDREQATDQLRADIRDDLRTLHRLELAYEIEFAGVTNAERRVKRTEMLREAGRDLTTARDVIEAKEALIRSKLSLTGVKVDFAVAKLQLLRDLEAFPLEPLGARYDPRLKIPEEILKPTESPPGERGSEER